MYLIIHAEVFEYDDWRQVGPYFKSSFPELKDQLTDRPCDEQNPILYEILTGKRPKCNNTLTKIAPIDNRISFFYSDEYDKFYISLNNIIKYNWDAQISDVGIISEWQYRRLKQDSIWPAKTDRYIFNQNSKVVTPFEMDMILKNNSLRTAEKYYVQFEHNARPIYTECRFFCDETIPALMKLVPAGGTYDDVRLVCIDKT